MMKIAQYIFLPYKKKSREENLSEVPKNSFSNISGFIPLGHRVLVLPDVIEKKTESGIILALDTVGREDMAQIKGTVIAIGDGCWKDTTTSDWAAPGDRIVFGKYSGLVWEGSDGQKYRILNDLDVVGLITEGNANGK
jgi:chaperonin GroES